MFKLGPPQATPPSVEEEYRAWERGDSFQEIADRCDETRQAVAQRLAAHANANGLPMGGSPRDRWFATVRPALIAAFVRFGDERLALDAATAGTTPKYRIKVADVKQVVEEDGLETHRKIVVKPHQKKFSDEELTGCLREASGIPSNPNADSTLIVDLLGGGGTRLIGVPLESLKPRFKDGSGPLLPNFGPNLKPLGEKEYDDWARTRELSPGRPCPLHQAHLLRHGTWAAALKSAGLPHGPRRGVDAKWSAASCVDAITRFCAATRQPPNAARYAEWSRAQRGDEPSLSTVRKHCGSWSAAHQSYLDRKQNRGGRG